MLYSVALYKLTGDKQHREVGLRAAEVLSQRFNGKGTFIRAWGRMDESVSPIGEPGLRTDNMAIIDCVMNLPLLYWTAKETDNQHYYDIAARHADMVLKWYIRPDGSVVRAVRFDLEAGQPVAVDNYCGYGRDSYWAREASWAIYGFALSYSYMATSRHIPVGAIIF